MRVHLVGQAYIDFYFPFKVDHGEAWADFDSAMAGSLGGVYPEDKRGYWIGGKATPRTEGS